MEFSKHFRKGRSYFGGIYIQCVCGCGRRGFKEDLGLWPDEIELVETTSIVNQINRLLLSVCSEEAPHLLTCQVDKIGSELELVCICSPLA